MALKKSQLYGYIWEACDELRGGMDASQYKDYVLVLLFVRYVSDKYAGKKNVDVMVPPGGSFADLQQLKGKKNIGEGVNLVLAKLAEANGLSGVINSVDFNDPEKLGSGKDMVDRLTNLITIFENPELDFSQNRAEGDDLLGDAYEYLMKHFATQSGKSKGQFYTPAEVSRIIAQVIQVEEAKATTQTVYDPACGSGSLLLKVASESPKGLTMYGQELDGATGTLAIINMWVHGEPTAVIEKGQSTLSTPRFVEKDGMLKTFDYVVANPPFSYKAWQTGFSASDDKFERFAGFGVPPDKNGDYAFLLHILKSLKSTGKGAVVLPHGVLFRGNAEALIRKQIVKRGYIKGVIGLPANIFFGTGIPACILVLDKEDAASRKGIFMVDAAKGFVKDGNKNRLREQDIRKIVDIFTNKTELPGFSRFVPIEEIADPKNDYNLNLPRYIDSAEVEDIQDIEAHLMGGIPDADIEALSPYWQVCPTLKKSIFKNNSRKGYSDLAVTSDTLRELVLNHSEFDVFRTQVLTTFKKWRTSTDKKLKGVSSTDHPKAIIFEIAKNLLTECASLPLIDKYNIYQNLMTYWSDVMQDDMHIITAEGWNAQPQLIRLQKTGKKGKKDVVGLVGLEGKLIPVDIVTAEYLATEKQSFDEAMSTLESVQAQLEELKEEHAIDDGLLSSVVENDKVTQARVKARIKEITKEPKLAEDGELPILEKTLGLYESEKKAKDNIKAAETMLEKELIKTYKSLTEADIKRLVVERKWLDSIEAKTIEEVDKLSHNLAGRVQELALRYETTLPTIESDVTELSKKVEEHLKKMGFVWK